MADNKESFIPLNEYSSEEKPLRVSETMILEKGDDDEGTYGKIIDRSLSFIPRAMRFAKGKKIMKRSLNKFIKKSKRVIDKFSKSFQNKVGTIEPEYKELKKKVEKLVAQEKDIEAKSAMEVHLKELESYKKEQMQILEKGIDDIFQAYTNAIDNRIDAPGFVLNVELSEKGKGELKAKWQELGAVAKMKIDEYKTVLISSPGWKKIDEIIAEINAFVEERKYAKIINDADFFVEKISEVENGFKVTVLFRMSGARLKAVEKGLLITKDPNVEFSEATREPYTGTNRYQLGGFKTTIGKIDQEYFLIPYIVVKEVKAPIIGKPAQIGAFLSGKRDMNTETDIDQEGKENSE